MIKFETFLTLLAFCWTLLSLVSSPTALTISWTVSIVSFVSLLLLVVELSICIFRSLIGGGRRGFSPFLLNKPSIFLLVLLFLSSYQVDFFSMDFLGLSSYQFSNSKFSAASNTILSLKSSSAFLKSHACTKVLQSVKKVSKGSPSRCLRL